MKNFFHSYKNPVSVLLAAIIACGIFFYSRIEISLFPDVTFPKIKVIADFGEQPVDKMMILVTRPLENAVKQIPNLKLVRSTTSRGSCEISAFLQWNSDIDLNLQMLQMRIDQIKNDLPPSVNIEVEKMNPSILPVMGYALESKTKSPIELNILANYTIKPFLSQIEGVSEVRVIGGKTKEYWLVLNPGKISSFGLTPEMVSGIINQTNFIQTNGYASDYRRLYLTITNAGIYNKTDLENIIVKNDGKRVIKLKDIASVEIHERKEFAKINANGRQALLVAILKQPNANLILLNENVLEKKKELEKRPGKSAAAVDLNEAARNRFERLRIWRSEVAKAHNLPAYVIFHDTTLAEIARTEPSTLDELSRISGIGERKLEAYGDEVLAALQDM